MEDEVLFISTIFKALTKPAMIFGVAYDYFFISGLFIMLVFIYSNNLLALLMFFPLHLVGWILSQLDPHIFRLLSIRANIGSIKNKMIWKCQSYDQF